MHKKFDWVGCKLKAVFDLSHSLWKMEGMWWLIIVLLLQGFAEINA